MPADNLKKTPTHKETVMISERLEAAAIVGNLSLNFTLQDLSAKLGIKVIYVKFARCMSQRTDKTNKHLGIHYLCPKAAIRAILEWAKANDHRSAQPLAASGHDCYVQNSSASEATASDGHASTLEAVP